jgi:outer membrane protein assembly factor BamB
MSGHASIPVLIDFHYGGLDPDATARVRRHLNDCDACHTLSVSLRGERDALRAAVHASGRGEIREAVAPAAERGPRRPWGVRVAAACLVVGVSLGVVLPAITLRRLSDQREQHALEIRRWRDEVDRLAGAQELAARLAREQSERSALLENQWTLLREQLAQDLARTESRLTDTRDRTALDLAGLRETVDREKAKSDAQAGEAARVRKDLETQLAQEREKRREELKAHQAELADLARNLRAQEEAIKAAQKEVAKAVEKPAPPPQPKTLALYPDDGVSLAWEPPARVNVPGPLSCRGNPVGWALQIGISGSPRPVNAPEIGFACYTGVAAVKERIFVGSGFNQKNLLAFNPAGKQLWEHVSGDNGVGTPVLSDDGETVYFSTESCTIDAVSTATGRGLWSRRIGNTAMTQPALYGRTRLYVVAPGSPASVPPDPTRPKDEGLKGLDLFKASSPSGSGGGGGGSTAERSMPFTLWCLNPRDGAVVWTRGLPAEVASSPVVDDGKLVVTTRDGSISVFQAESGQPLWSTPANATTAPCLVGGTLYFTTWANNSKFGFEESLVSVPIEGGMRRLVAGPFPASYLLSLDAPPAKKDVVDGPSKDKKSVTDAPDKDMADASEGASPEDKVLGPLLRRTRPALPVLRHEWAYLGGRPTVADDQAFVAVGNRVLDWDLKRNSAKWDLAVGGEGEGVLSIGQGQPCVTPPAYADGRLYFGSIWGDLMCVDAASGRLCWRYRLPKGQGIVSQVVLDRGSVIATTRKGLLVAIDTKDAAATGWPMWGGSPGHNGRK